jgi:hypothetical protein
MSISLFDFHRSSVIRGASFRLDLVDDLLSDTGILDLEKRSQFLEKDFF